MSAPVEPSDGAGGAGDGSYPPSRRYDRAIRSAAAARRRLDDGIEVLGRLVPLALKLSRLVGVYVAVVGVAAAVVTLVLLVRFWPADLTDWVVHLFLAVALFAPAVVLWMFHRALAEVVAIPARLAAMPTVAREHGSELAALVREAQGRRGGLSPSALPGDLWRAGRLLLAARDDLPGYGAVLALVSVPFLLVTVVAAVAGLVVIALVPVVIVASVVSSLV